MSHTTSGDISVIRHYALGDSVKGVLVIPLLAGAAILISACTTLPRDQELSALGADALEVRDYTAAEGHLREALSLNPANEYALLNLGVVYHDTGRSELARRTYGEIIRLNRTERAARTVARIGVGPRPEELARENLTDLNLDPMAIDGQAAPRPDWYGENGHTEISSLALLYRGMGEMFENLRQLSETMRRMTTSVKVAAHELETRMLADTKAAEDAARRVAVSESMPQQTMVSKAPSSASSVEMTDDGEGAIQLMVREEDAAANDGPVAIAHTADNTLGPDEPGMASDGGDETDPIAARAEPADDGADGPPVRIHIASFRSEKGAERGWEMLRKAHGDLLGALGLELRKVDFGAGMGVFFRVQVGPVESENVAKSLCQELKSRGLYCSVAFL